jgi:hypothetical protein
MIVMATCADREEFPKIVWSTEAGIWHSLPTVLCHVMYVMKIVIKLSPIKKKHSVLQWRYALDPWPVGSHTEQWFNLQEAISMSTKFKAPCRIAAGRVLLNVKWPVDRTCLCWYANAPTTPVKSNLLTTWCIFTFFQQSLAGFLKNRT